MKNLKILYLNISDIKGGAAIGGYRLHRGLIKRGDDSRLIVRQKFSSDKTVFGPKNKFSKLIYLIRRELAKAILTLQKTKNSSPHSINCLPSGMHRYINDSDADIVQLHWVGQEIISISEIAKINKPIVWRLADMWAFCGSEHLTGHIHNHRFKHGYNRENREDCAGGLDIDRWTWKRKLKNWSDKRIHVVASSSWLEKCAKESMIFRNCPVYKIPNGIDTNVYKPINKDFARYCLNLDKNKFIVLFGACDPIKDKHKGHESLLNAFKKLPVNSNIALAVFGASSFDYENAIDITCYDFGFLHDDYTLSLLYSAADITIVPSLQESFGLVAAESLACGTPVVAYANTGVADLIAHKKNGYLAEFNSAVDLLNGILWLYGKYKYSEMQELCEESRNTILKNFTLDLQIDRYLELYEKILKET